MFILRVFVRPANALTRGFFAVQGVHEARSPMHRRVFSPLVSCAGGHETPSALATGAQRSAPSV